MKDPLTFSSLFSSFGNDVAGISDRAGLLEVLAEHLRGLLTVSDILLSVVNEDRATHSVNLYHCDAVRRGACDHSALEKETFRLDDGVCNITMASPSPLMVDLAGILLRSDAPRYIAQWNRPSITRMISVRLRSHQQQLGALFIFMERPVIGINDLDTVQHLSYMVAPALKNILAEEHRMRELQDHTALLTMGADLMQAADMQDLFHQWKTGAGKLFGFSHCVLLLVDGQRGTLRDAIDEDGKEYLFRNDLIASALAAGGPQVFDLEKQLSPDLPAFMHVRREQGDRVVLAAALWKDGEAFGLMMVFGGAGTLSTPRHLRLIEAAARQLSPAFTHMLERQAMARMAREQRVLLSFGRDLAAVRNYRELLSVLGHTLSRLVAYDGILLSGVDPDGGNYRVLLDQLPGAFTDDTAYAGWSNSQWPVDEIYDEMLVLDAPKVYDMETSPALSGGMFSFLREGGMRQLLALPLREGNGSGYGVAFLFFGGTGALDLPEAAMLAELGQQLSLGASNLRALQVIQRQLEDIHQNKYRLEEENLYLQEQIKTAHGFTEMVGTSSAMSRVMQLVSMVSPSDSTVLILGETGTGKELVAKAIHAASPRKDKFMIQVNCAALPVNLVESELFGHEKGSFTGAIERRIGKFELANESTLFLDEIGEMPLELQAKLLRAIQEREIERIGGKGPIKTNVRIIAATNRDLRREVEAGRFRNDLFYRLNVFPVQLPPLRDRKEDLPMLASHFINVQAQRSGKRILNISQRVLEQLMRYDWPGNVRELEHLIERSVLMTTGPTIREIPLPTDPEGYPAGIAAGAGVRVGAAVSTLEELEKEHILAVLKKCKHKVGGPGGAAEMLRMPATTLHSRIKKLGLRKNLE